MEDIYVIKEGKKLRCGYTTGSCATAAAKAAALMLKTNKKVNFVEIDTPAEIKLRLEIVNIIKEKDIVSCCVIKDGGDDPDVTDGMEICVKVKERNDGKINIDGGKGIGRIKRKGLFGKVGQVAINPVPKQMIEKELKKVSDQGYDVIVYAPLGEKIAEKTYNERIGIEGGISIIGTKGIVYPMSEDALKKTIYMEINNVLEDYGKEHIVIVLGNYGEKIADKLGFKGGKVKVSNFIGDSLLYAYNKGFKSITLIGHIGKLSKLSLGSFNTHSKICDGRMESFIYYLAFRKAPLKFLEKINNCLTAEEAINLCIEKGYGEVVKDMTKGCEERIQRYLKDENFPIKVLIYSMEKGVFL